MATFARVLGWVLYVALIALGFWLVHIYRDDDSVATVRLVVLGCVPVIVGFVLGWGGNDIGMRLDSRPCPRCGRRVGFGTYVCASCGFDFRTRTAQTGA